MTMAKIAITLPRDRLGRIKRAVKRGEASSVSAYIVQALAEYDQGESLLDLLDEMDEELGPPSPEDKAWARRVAEGIGKG